MAQPWGRANGSRGRRTWSAALGVLAAVLLLLSVVALYANRVLFDSDQFANHVGAAVDVVDRLNGVSEPAP